jgi:DNA polymerase-1
LPVWPLEDVLAHVDDLSGTKRRELLREHSDLALLSKKLASLEHDAPVDIDAAEVHSHQPQRGKLEELFSRFEFSTLLERVEPLLPNIGEEVGTAPVSTGFLSVRNAPGEVETLENLFDWTRTIGLAVEEGGQALWLAQADRMPLLDDYGGYTVVRIDDAAGRHRL